MVTDHAIIANQYFDSVFLMRVAKRISAADGIELAAAVMATAKNLEALAQAGFASAAHGPVAPNDVIVAVRASDAAHARAVLDNLDKWLTREETIAATTVTSLGEALRVEAGANLAVISVPGEYAAREARAALEQGLHVFVFSDNVSLDDEVALKQLSHERGLLLMGPDCGTAIIGGAGLGFADSVRRGPVGVVGAAGTGLQEVTTLVHRLGSGIAHAIGTGSHDLSDAVGGVTALQALDALEADPNTKVIALISKPPGQVTLQRIKERLRLMDKPVVTCFLGTAVAKGDWPHPVGDLEEAARESVRLAGGAHETHLGGVDTAARTREALATFGRRQQYVRGLFAGGTFCYQAQQVFRAAGLIVHSNEPLSGSMRLDDPYRSVGHCLVDMGADVFTVGRPHPMIDSTLRAQRVVAEAQDAETAVLLLDFVLGFGSSQDPAGDLAPSIKRARDEAKRLGGALTVVASVCGTDLDTQGYDKQVRTLEDAGALVFPSAVTAARFAAALAVDLQKVRA
ncbi:MAG: acyl-CoA synthetase FdrA [Chloroflexi bacterium]|nr:acyl-CoA synthetase FdrA [Chloroflexota bacterium]